MSRVVLGLLAIVLLGARGDAVTIVDYFVSPPGSTSLGVAAGPDGNVWFTMAGANAIGRVTPGGLMTTYVIPTPDSQPYQLVTGPDGNVWFTESLRERIGRLSPTTGTFTEFLLPSPGAGPLGIAVGSDGALWFTEGNLRRIGRITTAGAITEFPVATVGSGPNAITPGPDGALWFTYQTGIGRITPGGSVTLFPLPMQVVNGLAIGPDGRLWFPAYLPPSARATLVRMALDGSYDLFPLLEGRYPFGGIAAGADGNLWFADTQGVLGRVTVEGTITEFRLATPSATYFVTSGPDGNVWFTEGDHLGKVVLSSAGFYSVTPCRAIDTRGPPGPHGAPSLAAGSTRVFTITGSCGIPMLGTFAVATNMTVVNQTDGGDLRVSAAGSPTPPTSAINFAPGLTRANNAILGVSLDGQLGVFCSMPMGSTDLVVDVVGYFQ